MGPASEMQVPMDQLLPGPRTLRVELVAVNHGPFGPPVESSVRFVKMTG